VENRDEVARALAEAGVKAKSSFQGSVRFGGSDEDPRIAFSVASGVAERSITLPPYLSLSDCQIATICDVVAGALARS